MDRDNTDRYFLQHIPTPCASAFLNRVDVDLLGIFIGLNAACINVITEWLSDFKLGYCAQGWYLNQQFCCWREDVETCPHWRTWSSFVVVNYIFYILFAVRHPSMVMGADE
jgi:hypothetical protein